MNIGASSVILQTGSWLTGDSMNGKLTLVGIYLPAAPPRRFPSHSRKHQRPLSMLRAPPDSPPQASLSPAHSVLTALASLPSPNTHTPGPPFPQESPVRLPLTSGTIAPSATSHQGPPGPGIPIPLSAFSSPMHTALRLAPSSSVGS